MWAYMYCINEAIIGKHHITMLECTENWSFQLQQRPLLYLLLDTKKYGFIKSFVSTTETEYDLFCLKHETLTIV